MNNKELMKRPQHSFTGYLRTMQMSEVNLFVFVEGKECDPFFYGNICQSVKLEQIKYEIVKAQQLPYDTGGKKALLDFFMGLRGRNKLITNFKGKKTGCVFFVDKDIDDIKRKRKRSIHVMYTQYYDVQNYIYKYGDLVKGASAAASIDPINIEKPLKNSSDWCKQAAIKWYEWVVLCVFISLSGIAKCPNYRIHSTIQTRICGITDINKYDLFIVDLASKMQISKEELTRRLERTYEKVANYYKQDEYHKVFKGKWYSEILSDNIKQMMKTQYEEKSLSSRLPNVIVATLDFTGSWADHLRKPLIEISTKLIS